MVYIGKINDVPDWLILPLGIYENEYKNWLNSGYFIKINDIVYTALNDEFWDDIEKEKMWARLQERTK